MPCPICHKPTSHEACWQENKFWRQWNYLFTDPGEDFHTVTGDWQTKTVSINGRKLTGEIFHQFMQIDPLWDWDDSQDNYEDALNAWDKQFSWGDESPGTFFCSIALQRYITMRMSLMQQFFYPTLVALPQADFSLTFSSKDLFQKWMELEEKFGEEFTAFLGDHGFQPVGRQRVKKEEA